MGETLPAIVLLWAPFGCLVVGALYLATSAHSQSLAWRLSSSAYAPAAAALFISVTLLPLQVRGQLGLVGFVAAQAIPFGLLVVSLRKFSGPKWVHPVLVPVALVCMLWQAAIGYISLVGK